MLTDGVDPTFPAWRKLLLGKFLRNDDHFRNDAEKMDYVFRSTGGTAQKLLDPLYLTNSPHALATSQQMIDHLATCFENSQEKADARDEYATLRQSSQESFRDFQVRFVDIANRAEVPEDTQLDDIFRKIRLELQEGLLTERRRWASLSQAMQEIDTLDKERTSYLWRSHRRLPVPTSSSEVVAGTTTPYAPTRSSPSPYIPSRRSPTLYAPPRHSSTPLYVGVPPTREPTTASETRTYKLEPKESTEEQVLIKAESDSEPDLGYEEA
jgi:hypothetical protein